MVMYLPVNGGEAEKTNVTWLSAAILEIGVWPTGRVAIQWFTDRPFLVD